ncbi:hypothetical protein [Rhizobium aethiopicum]|uniref:hypothetical protein n=1 Tax=Rhizobium aethiopicum TaxID=1138170 RepID=UPI000B8856C9|nr:hypothetical protein [Rhizobium aethiopicum]
MGEKTATKPDNCQITFRRSAKRTAMSLAATASVAQTESDDQGRAQSVIAPVLPTAACIGFEQGILPVNFDLTGNLL